MSYIIGMCGPSGAGKTTILQQLQDQFGLQLSVINLDNYYKPIDQQGRDANGEINFDLPSGLYLDECVADIQSLANGQAIERLEYTFNNPIRSAQMLRIEPTALIIVEGIFVLCHDALRDLLDYQVSIYCPLDECLRRRLARDGQERNYDEQAVRYQWKHHVEPAYAQYVEPYLQQCDIQINTHQAEDDGLQVLIRHLEHKLL